MIELFCGTKSVSKVFLQRPEWSACSVDVEASFEPDLVADVLDLPLDFVRGADVLWCSPPCTAYSRAKTCGPRDLQTADSLSLHSVNLCKACTGIWFIENPASGMLKDRPWMQELPWADVSYCHYGFPYRKNTRIWSNLWTMTSWRPKMCKKDCLQMVGSRHRCTAQRGPSYPHDRTFTQRELYRVPPALLEQLFIATRTVLATRALLSVEATIAGLSPEGPSRSGPEEEEYRSSSGAPEARLGARTDLE